MNAQSNLPNIQDKILGIFRNKLSQLEVAEECGNYSPNIPQAIRNQRTIEFELMNAYVLSLDGHPQLARREYKNALDTWRTFSDKTLPDLNLSEDYLKIMTEELGKLFEETNSVIESEERKSMSLSSIPRSYVSVFSPYRRTQ